MKVINVEDVVEASHVLDQGTMEERVVKRAHPLEVNPEGQDRLSPADEPHVILSSSDASLRKRSTRPAAQLSASQVEHTPCL